MTGHEYSEVIDRLGLSRVGAARFLNVNETTARRWVKDQHPIPLPVVALLRVMIRYSLTPDNVLQLLHRHND